LAPTARRLPKGVQPTRMGPFVVGCASSGIIRHELAWTTQCSTSTTSMAARSKPHHWTCMVCTLTTLKMNNKSDKIAWTVNKQGEKIANVEQKQETQSLQMTIAENTTKANSKEIGAMRQRMKDIKRICLKVSCAEQGERKSNRNNVVIHQMNESSSAEISRRKDHNIDIIIFAIGLMEMNGAARGTVTEGIKFYRRIGPRDENQHDEKPRSLKVGFAFTMAKAIMMVNAKNLNNIMEGGRITVSADLT
jgi:hypothetical protein